jgi:hypothetical protein
VFLLLCPNHKHYVWVGREFDCKKAGIAVPVQQDEDGREPLPPRASDVLRWVARVHPGEVRLDSSVGKHFQANPAAINVEL